MDTHDHQWTPTREQAYLAVQMVIEEGKCAAQIAQTLFNSRESRAIQRVESLLKYAHKSKVFTLTCPVNEPLQGQLAERYGQKSTFHVVNNDQTTYPENSTVDQEFRADAVAQRAAVVLAERIRNLLIQLKEKKRKRIVIANAGGYAVSRVVRFLDAHKLVPDECNLHHLLFISLNSASMPTDYDRSANTLAVRLAGICGGQHMALTPIWPQETARAYERAVAEIDLLVCGAGARSGILFTWLKDHANIVLPAKAVGDICLIPISDQGNEVPLDHAAPVHVRKYLNPHPSFTQLRELAAHDRVLLVATGFQADDRRHSQPAGPTHSKLPVTRTILKYALARTCVLGATLAHDLLATTTPTDTESPG